MSSGTFTEDQLVEQPAIELLDDLGWDTVNAYAELLGPDGTLGRDNHGEIYLLRHLVQALQRLNPGLPTEALDAAIVELTKPRSVLDSIRANREVYELLRNGVPVQVRNEDGSQSPERVQLIDWRNPGNNDFLLVSQFRVSGDIYNRRADLVGFVNGIPLVFIELKASHKKLEDAYTGNLRDYRETIPALFVPNAFIILSNGSQSKIGTVSSQWEHFAEWKKIDEESEPGVVSLETMLRGTCDPSRLLDIVENFIAFTEQPRGLIKMLARNHQYLGVNNAIDRLLNIRTRPDGPGRLGVFWHTQGSGKTLSMLFFSQKVLRTVPGNWTFVIVTDRTDLDDQAYESFADAGVLTEGHVQATSGQNLQQLLSEDHRYVFTLIQKFRADQGQTYPVLSARSDIVVITDEAHRSQYDTLALNMRNALPNASFLGFTGTPLIVGEEKTREVFGDYVSVYDFGDSIRDGSTVPLYYENRIPELQINNPDFDDELEALLDGADLDDAQERKLARLFGQQYQLITREERLDRIAVDLVDHFLGRGFAGKAMVISIDKATAVRMYDKVHAMWQRRLNEARAAGDTDLADYMASTGMAVVVSQAQNEVADMAAKGLDITSHRARMVNDDLESRFKDPADPLRIVFVCAMWTTGFDVPSCSTIYLDKPMKNHTLMQTIARANRVFPEKTNGLIVDYVGVFRNLEKALAIYASPGEGGSSPVQPKDELVALLKQCTADAVEYCTKQGVDITGMLKLHGFDMIAAADDAVEKLIATDDTKMAFLAHARLVDRLFSAILPDPAANDYGPTRAVLVFLSQKIHALSPTVDIGSVMSQVEDLLDRSVAAKAYVIRATETDGEHALIDLNAVDWDALAQKFATGRKRSEAERLKAAVAAKTNAMARLNPTRTDLVEKLQELIADYNSGSLNVEEFFDRLVQFTKELDEEERRALAENLTEEELAIYDLITRPAPELTDAETKLVKAIAHELLAKLKAERLVLDWRKQQQSRAAVRVAVETELDHLPRAFDVDTFQTKCDLVYQHIYDNYWDDGRSTYTSAA